MTKRKGRYVAKAADAPAKTPKALKTAAALYALERGKLEKQHAALLQAREQKRGPKRVTKDSYHPDKLLEKVERYMQRKGWEFDLDPPVHAQFSADRALLAARRQIFNVSFKFATGRKIEQVWEQIRLGWYGDPNWEGQPGGWRAANRGNLVRHSIGEMDKWIANDAVLKGSIRNLKTPEGYDIDDVLDKTIVEDDGVEAQKELELADDLADLINGSQENREV